MPNLNTRIALKYATLAQWEVSTLELMNGEVAFGQATDGSIIMKVGPGVWSNAKEVSLSELANYYTKNETDALLAALQEAIEAETERALAEEDKLSKAIAAEVTRATGVENELRSDITGLNDTINGTGGLVEQITANKLAAAAAQGQANINAEVLKDKISMKDVEDKNYATKEEAQGYANAKDAAIATAQSTADQAKAAIDAFLNEEDLGDAVVNTLKEIQNNLNTGKDSAASLLSEINQIKDGTTVVPKADNANTLDGKQATEFATAEQGAKADAALQEADLTGVTGDVSITKNEQGKYDVQLKPASVGSGELTAEAVKVANIGADVFKGSNGVKVQKTAEGITYSIDESVEWIFNCGGAN